jgi:hypothetical protein
VGTLAPSATPTLSGGGGVILSVKTPTPTATSVPSQTATSEPFTATPTAAPTAAASPTESALDAQDGSGEGTLFPPAFVKTLPQPVQDALHGYERFNNGLGKPFGMSPSDSVTSTWSCCFGLIGLLIAVTFWVSRGRRGEAGFFGGDKDEEDDDSEKTLASKDQHE